MVDEQKVYWCDRCEEVEINDDVEHYEVRYGFICQSCWED